ncbi:MAG: CTP synthetase [Chloroflexi bacterium]|nr:CTP synthetase [Chloroflexota bacterium]|tara:strand:- start:5893 stop:7527 length:1635 start_codon:yes stop_codon:yes gene_type:complete
MSKYIFVTGGVVSSLGKGIVSASIGRILKSRGFSVTILKLDPYLNIDPGTMSPYQHGEVFVTRDGSETDLDLGHYERFIDEELTKNSNVTAGQIYSEVINEERKGTYLGGTIQTVPHVTDVIKNKISHISNNGDLDIVILEIGGTVGDIEGQPFLESIRQIRNDIGAKNTFSLHLTLLPFLGATKELKTKPTQHSVNTLRGTGIQPDAIICRSDFPVEPDVKKKISLYCDVPEENVFSLETLDTIYAVPLVLEEQAIGDILVNKLGLKNTDIRPSHLKDWSSIVDLIRKPKDSVKIAVVGKYADLPDSYLSVKEALIHAGIDNGYNIDIEWISSERLEVEDPEKLLSLISGIVIPGGFGPRGIEGMIKAANYSRVRGIPYLGLCLGMQIMVVEFTRSKLGLELAHSIEFDPDTPDPVISFLPGQEDIFQKGGTMRLGIYPCKLEKGSVAMKAYKKTLIEERHRHRYEVNNEYRSSMEKAGLLASGVSPDNNLVEISEIVGHPFMVGSQFHPEFLSRPNNPHPLFREFVNVAKKIIREGSQHKLV